MMVKHRLRIDFDEDTGELSVTHRCTVGMAEQVITFSETVNVPDTAAMLGVLSDIIEVNRASMERRAVSSAVEHVVAVAGQVQHRQRQVKTGGTVGPAGRST